MNGEETNGGVSLDDMEKALICLLMTSMEAPVRAEYGGLTSDMFADGSLGFVYEVIMKIHATGVRPDMVLVERGMREADEKKASKLGGLSFLLPYMLNVRHDGNVAAYVDGIKKQYKLRCLATLFSTMAFKSGEVSSVPEELVDEAERQLMEFRQYTSEGAPVRTIGELAVEAMAWHHRRFGGGLETEQVKSGLTEFDYVTGGFHNTELTIIAGRPSDRENGCHVADGAERGACREIGLFLQSGNVELADAEPRVGGDDGREPGPLACQQTDRTRVGCLGRGCRPLEGSAFLSRLYGRGYRRTDTCESHVAMPSGEMRPGGRGLLAPLGRRTQERRDAGTDGRPQYTCTETTGAGLQPPGADGFADEPCLRVA